MADIYNYYEEYSFSILAQVFFLSTNFWYRTRLWTWKKDQSRALWGGPVAAAWGCDVPVCPACRWGDIQEAQLDGSHSASAEVGLSQCPGHMLCQAPTALLVLEAFSDLELPPWAYHSRPGCTPAPATQEGWHVQRAGWYKSTNNGDTLPSQDPWPQNKNTSAGDTQEACKMFLQ